MKLFCKYLKQRWRIFGVGALFCCVFALTFSLYHLPVKAVLYPTGLCFLMGTAFLILDFKRVKTNHVKLAAIQKLTDAVTMEFPKIETVQDADYQSIIHRLCEQQQTFRTEAGERYSNMVEYYTVWAHQIKTPIASMRLNLQNEDSVLSRKLSSDLFRVEQYVEMVLVFLKLDGRSSDYVIRQCDLNEIIRRAVKKFAGEFIGRKLKLIYEPVEATVITDEKWLSFVIEQVISNALKYTPSGSIAITLTPEKKLCIQDTGIGIAPEDLPRIFENGYTGYNGRADRKASGIGLYLCKRICGNLGHGISAQSQVDVGTCITIDLAQRDLKVE